jgi:hypothetical protein
MKEINDSRTVGLKEGTENIASDKTIAGLSSILQP